MKKIFLTLALGAAIAIPALAQTPHHVVKSRHHNDKVNQIRCNTPAECISITQDAKCEYIGDRPEKGPFNGIQLTDAQKQKIDKERGKRNDKIKKAREKARSEHNKARDNYLKGLKKILTPEQFAKLQDNISKSKKACRKNTNCGKHEKGTCTDMRPGLCPEGAGPAPATPLDYKK